MTGTATHQHRHQQQAGHAFARLLPAVLCLLLAAAMLPSPPAAAATTSIRVSARILPWLDLSTTPRISSYLVDAAAIQRGFIDLPKALSIRLATNLHREIVLSLTSSGPGRILLADGPAGASEQLRVPAFAGTQPVIRDLSLRVILPSDMKEGLYPLQINISALDI